MLDLFFPPKPYELTNREPSYVHRMKGRWSVQPLSKREYDKERYWRLKEKKYRIPKL